MARAGVRLALLLIAVVSSYCLLVSAEEWHRHTNPASGRWHEKSTHLLEHAEDEPTDVQLSTKEKVAQIKAEIKNLSQVLHEQQGQLWEIQAQQDAIKAQSFFWFNDPELRHQVDLLQLQVNDQLRLVENTFDDIAVHWRQLKPLYGVFSKMFLFEFIHFMLDPFFLIFNFIFSTFGLGFILTFILWGPIAITLFYLLFQFGVQVLPYVLFVGLQVYWAFNLPFLLLQYGPSWTQFLAVYVPFLAVVYLVSWGGGIRQLARLVRAVLGRGRSARGVVVPPPASTRPIKQD
ncbi:hypothetical protein QOT17_002966 [Balamuthia mandrillaris]